MFDVENSQIDFTPFGVIVYLSRNPVDLGMDESINDIPNTNDLSTLTVDPYINVPSPQLSPQLYSNDFTENSSNDIAAYLYEKLSFIYYPNGYQLYKVYDDSENYVPVTVVFGSKHEFNNIFGMKNSTLYEKMNSLFLGSQQYSTVPISFNMEEYSSHHHHIKEVIEKLTKQTLISAEEYEPIIEYALSQVKNVLLHDLLQIQHNFSDVTFLAAFAPASKYNIPAMHFHQSYAKLNMTTQQNIWKTFAEKLTDHTTSFFNILDYFAELPYQLRIKRTKQLATLLQSVPISDWNTYISQSGFIEEAELVDKLLKKMKIHFTSLEARTQSNYNESYMKVFEKIKTHIHNKTTDSSQIKLLLKSFLSQAAKLEKSMIPELRILLQS